MSSSVVSKKLKFKGDRPKKKKRTHRETGGEEGDELEALAAADPSGWVFPDDIMEVSGPSFIILPTQPLSCLAWDTQRQRVYAAPLDTPEAPEGASDLTMNEILATIEPTDVNHVWVISRLSGSESVISLRTSTGTFLTATPSGTITASTPSRGPLESFVPTLTSTDTTSSSSNSDPFPTLTLQTQNSTYLSATPMTGLTPTPGKGIAELRGDAEDDKGEGQRWRIKCQREFVIKAKIANLEARGEGLGKGKRRLDGGVMEGSLEDEAKRNREAQAWGAGRSIVSESDRRDLKKARKDGRLAEAMLDRRAALKSDRYAK